MSGHFKMLICFGEYLQTGLRNVFRKLAKQTSAQAEELYQEAISLKDGEGRNLRDAFKKFEEASGSGHTEATKELAECYLHGRGCEKDVMKAAELGDSKLNLEMEMKWRRGGK